MKNAALLFEFKVDKNSNTVYVDKTFTSDLSSVWDAFTKQEILDLWWAPKPWKSKTKYMNFEVGGRRFYAMVSPEGQEHWSIQSFTSISPKSNFQFYDAFTDAEENVITEMPSSNWDLNFSESNSKTKVSISIQHETLEDLEMSLEMGFKEGFTMTLSELEIILNQ